jgi:predicted ATPase
MPPYTEVAGGLLVGRKVELTQLSAALHRAAHREADTVLVFGEAGVGKTALVKEALHSVDSDQLLLSGACLPLQSITVPLLPLRTALRAALPGGHLARMDKVSAPDEALGLLDAWLEEVTRTFGPGSRPHCWQPQSSGQAELLVRRATQSGNRGH